MLAQILPSIGKALTGMILRTLTAKFFEEIILYCLEYGAKSTKATWDDELVSLVKKHLDNKSENGGNE